MKKLFIIMSLLTMSLAMNAVPAKKGIWKTVTLTDGTQVKVELVGDEFGHYWRAADGRAFREDGTTAFFHQVNAEEVIKTAQAKRQAVNAKRVQRLPKRAFGEPSSYLGKKKGIIILVNYKDQTFKASNDNALYQRIANEEGFSEGDFKGSMSDYFKAQSNDKFELDFDVVGPVTVSEKASYYGSNDSEGNDKYAGQMVCEAVKLAMEQVSDWKQYDWDGDGYVDQVYVVYCGKGEADGGAANTIWPHAYDLSSAKAYGDGTGPVEVATGLKVNSYACGAELNGYTGTVAGIGTMCHEFSHCLGYPDFYDTDYSGGWGMDCWDLMDNGSYNGDGYQPAGYTSYERWFAGWQEPVELNEEDVAVENLKSLQEGGVGYIIYNKGNKNEYYLLENRQQTGWDASLPGNGLLIIHVDYDKTAWTNNAPNDDPKHQRMTWVAADNQYQYQTYSGTKYLTEAGLKNDPFPYGTKNAFNKGTTPAATFFNKNTDGTKYMDSSVENITRNSDGTISFKFVAKYVTDGGGGGDTPAGSTLLSETFDDSDGEGGNDGQWSGNLTMTALTADDYPGWDFEKGYAANQCVKLGTSKINGKATSPTFTVNGTAKVTFRAGAWNATNDGTVLNLSVDNGTITPATVDMTKGGFTDFEATITATGDVRVTFEAQKLRFFLDDVLVTDPNATGINAVKLLTPAKTGRIFTIDGRYVGSDLQQQRSGLYVIDGKKVVVK